MVTVTPPVDAVELFHDFVQLSTSPRYRRPYQAGSMPAGLAKDLLDEQFAQANAERDAAVGTVPLSASDEVDFTLGGATLVLEPATLARNGMTDRELIEAYLTSDAVQVTGPVGAQAGYAVQPVAFELIGGTLPTPDGTLFSENGGFDAYLAQMEVEGITQPEDMIGLLVETEGSLLDAMNLAAQDANHPLYAILNAKAAGDTIELDLLFQQSNSVTSASENNAEGCITGDTALQETFVDLAGAEFCQVALENAQMLETDVPTVNSNQLLTAKVPECVTEIQEMAGGVTTLAAKANGKAIGCGVTDLGLVVCPANSSGEPTGECVILGMVLSSFVPEADPVNSYQFGFVFDSDGNSGNNWVPLPQFANDYFQDTDLWFAVEYSPFSGWRLNVTSAGKQSPASSAARAIIKDNTITLVVPRSEFASSTPTFRLTSFRHSGDYGQNPPYDWSADYHPRLNEALAKIPGLAAQKTAWFGCSARGGDEVNSVWDSRGDLALVAVAMGLLVFVSRRQRRGRPQLGGE